MGSLHRLFLSTDALMSTYDFHICFNSEGSQYAIENSHEDGLVLVVVVPAELQVNGPQGSCPSDYGSYMANKSYIDIVITEACKMANVHQLSTKSPY